MPKRLSLLVITVLSASLLVPCSAAAAAPHQAVIKSVGYKDFLESDSLKLSIENTGRFELLDKKSGVQWASNPYANSLGTAVLKDPRQKRQISLQDFDITKTGDTLILKDAGGIALSIAMADSGRALDFSYDANEGIDVESVNILENAFWVTDKDKGCMLIPSRMGILVPSDNGAEFSQRLETYQYQHLNMAMLGLVKKGSAALISWKDPYIQLDVQSKLNVPQTLDAAQILTCSVILSRTARSVRITILGNGDAVTIAKAYRRQAKKAGWVVTWDEKLKGSPDRAKLFGAACFRVGHLLSRRMSEDGKTEQYAQLRYTFDETAQIAEHLNNDLKLEKVIYLLDGWIRRGYDNQHPDILPAAPECGGNKALADCSRRVQELGYLFSLHDNYQGLYPGAPSWDKNLILVKADGDLFTGSRWAGGRPWVMCSRQALDIAKREDKNLPAVKKICNPNSYFIDTTLAVPLYDCYSEDHPMTKWDDMKYKQQTCAFARELFGVFGSEDGKEWGVPYCDYFEGIGGVSGKYLHSWPANWLEEFGAMEIPLFNMVYHDCVYSCGKYRYDVRKAADYVLSHISAGNAVNYSQMVGRHLYWKAPQDRRARVEEDHALNTLVPPSAVFCRADNGWAKGMNLTDIFVKNTYEVCSPLHRLTAKMLITGFQYLTGDRKVTRTVFGNGELTVVVNRSDGNFEYRRPDGTSVLLPQMGFVIESPDFAAFHSLSWAGRNYEKSVLFTITSLDGKPISKSRKLRIFHGFGEKALSIWNSPWSVRKEKVIERDG